MTHASERRRRLTPPERRASIAGSAVAALDERGFDALAVADVAQRAQVSEALVYHYFPTKADLYAAAVADRLEALERATREAVDALGPDRPARLRVRATIDALLDHVVAHPAAWERTLDGVLDEPAPAAAAREAARTRHLELLESFLHPDPRPRRRYALTGHVTHVDGLMREWVRRGTPADEREPLVEVALGALEGALGDWGR